MKTVKSLGLIILAVHLFGCGGSSAESQINAVDSLEPQSAATGSPPDIELLEQPPSVTQTPYARFVFTSQDANNFECRKDDNPVFEPCVSPQTLLSLAAGEHNFFVRAIRDDGLAGAAVNAQWTVQSIFSSTATSSVHPDLIATSIAPAPSADNSWRGILRINCDFAHSSYDDPIVFPGEAGAAHLHRFYGNTQVDENSSFESLFTEGDSSCQGNVLNRSAYWIPALIAPAYDPLNGQRLFDDFGEPAFKAVPAVVGDNDEAHEIFYYSAGVDDLESIQSIPPGLKMIAGDHMGQPGNQQDTAIARWHCQSWESSDAGNPRWSTSIPDCIAPDRLRMDIFFPSCWNGFDLDSYDHKSHLAYPVKDAATQATVCPDSHPTPIIRVSFHYAFGVKPEVYDPETQSSRGWKLASDMYSTSLATPGGMSLHGDWFNAWHPEALQAVLDFCIKNQLDCHDGNLANGYRLSGTREGTQVEPDISLDGV